jgi:hypothetical protein
MAKTDTWFDPGNTEKLMLFSKECKRVKYTEVNSIVIKFRRGAGPLERLCELV